MKPEGDATRAARDPNESGGYLPPSLETRGQEMRVHKRVRVTVASQSNQEPQELQLRLMC